MFALVKTAAILSAVASLAITGVAANPVTNGGCNQGTVSCCNTVQSPTSVQQEGNGGLLGGLLDELLGELGGLGSLGDILDLASKYPGDIGIGCDNPVNCQQQTVCCKDTTFNGVINVGCSPIIVNV